MELLVTPGPDGTPRYGKEPSNSTSLPAGSNSDFPEQPKAGETTGMAPKEPAGAKVQTTPTVWHSIVKLATLKPFRRGWIVQVARRRAQADQAPPLESRPPDFPQRLGSVETVRTQFLSLRQVTRGSVFSRLALFCAVSPRE